MGLLDDLSDLAEGVDFDADHAAGHGFDPDVCEGCPHQLTDKPGNPCDLCGCPTVSLGPMDLTNSPPADCIRLDRHAEGP